MLLHGIHISHGIQSQTGHDGNEVRSR